MLKMNNAINSDGPMPPVSTLQRRTCTPASLSDERRYTEDFDPIETLQISDEAPWDVPGEDLLHSWLEACKQQTGVHRKQGFKLKKLYKFFGILSIVSAGIVFFFANIKVSDDQVTDDIIHIFVAFVNLLVANLNNFLEYGPKFQKQFEFEGKYSKLAVDLEEILAIDAAYRAPKDRTLAEYKEKVGNLYVNAPEA